ncbi:hypothetical protein CLOSTHATH_00637 [Hungatella hathewayi DSM 13479]|uniref:Uncharacterized protein n=1 Tax=Hungatella hathewayi DSM 13479 TaxID=566550 RepID=D3AAL6_9FIRM|nr:hypothetical protein CLOSTHATH_00637 [Hungatella hathewayi DSM 13479]
MNELQSTGYAAAEETGSLCSRFFCVYRTLYRRFCFRAFFLRDTGQDVNCNLSAGNRQAETGKDRKIERNLV